ncbi:hypothetical protein MSG28_001016 [Choristoneura fumiferana]|uniref:Uncharacterized protein n=1 Tax=Choristoneura fumiferana TaxID=7141 RepID=A0ACC0K3D4_CHOFU|nr:hypothetical protein MSG28_001016 [Choristoneura fumiferana]
MHRWAILWQASTLLLVGGTLDFGYFARLRPDMLNSQVNCVEMPKYGSDYFTPKFYYGRRFPRQTGGIYRAPTAASFQSGPLLSLNRIMPRMDRLLPDTNDIVKEHAKLVQDINSLKQAVFVSPFAEESRDYEDSIFHEIIETATNSPKQTTKLPPKKGIPIVLLGGGSNQRQTVTSQPIKFPDRTSISLVGTSRSPLLKHPYPFAVNESQRTIKVCMSSTPTPTSRPSLLQRLLSAFIPR